MQNKTTYSPFMTLGQETWWAYSTMLPSSHGASALRPRGEDYKWSQDSCQENKLLHTRCLGSTLAFEVCVHWSNSFAFRRRRYLDTE